MVKFILAINAQWHASKKSPDRRLRTVMHASVPSWRVDRINLEVRKWMQTRSSNGWQQQETCVGPSSRSFGGKLSRYPSYMLYTYTHGMLAWSHRDGSQPRKAPVPAPGYHQAEYGHSLARHRVTEREGRGGIEREMTKKEQGARKETGKRDLENLPMPESRTASSRPATRSAVRETT